jgi:hypothetical protein
MSNRGPRLKGILAVFERLIAKPGALTRAVTFLGVSRSTVHRWREGIANPRAENVLALDEFVRTEVVVRIVERIEGTSRSRAGLLPQPMQTEPHRPAPEPELLAKDVSGQCQSRRNSLPVFRVSCVMSRLVSFGLSNRFRDLSLRAAERSINRAAHTESWLIENVSVNALAVLAFDHRQDAVAALPQTLAHHGIDLPMADLSAPIHSRRPISNHAFARQPASAVVALAALFAGTPQVRVQRATSFEASPDVAVDRLVADRQFPTPPQIAADLLRAPFLLQQRVNSLPLCCLELAVAPRPVAPGIRSLMGSGRAVPAIVGRTNPAIDRSA